MTGVLSFFHVLVCVFLGVIILLQSGRGGGLTESLSGAESMFGTQTSAFLIKTTAVLSTAFLVTCLSLAFLSSKRNESLMPNQVATQAQQAEQDIEDMLKDIPKIELDTPKAAPIVDTAAPVNP